MRRIWTSTDRTLIDRCCRELDSHEISHLVDSEKDLDWGSDTYGTVFFSIWAHADADVERAKGLLTQVSGTDGEMPLVMPNASTNSPLKQFLRQKLHLSLNRKAILHLPSRYVTIAICLLCCALLWLEHDEKRQTPELSNSTAVATTSIQEMLLFDYPKAVFLENKLIDSYGPESLDLTSKLNAEGTALRDLFLQTPYWGGFYTESVARLSKKDFIPTPSLSLSLFGERLRDGQLWRIFTPSMLHANIIHLVLNMTWLLAIGSQIEQKTSPFRYLLLIAILAAVSNTAQYLMAGANFMGFSGVICGMVGFIAARQQVSPWEGYHFTRLMYASVVFFIWVLVAIAGVAFFLESYLHIAPPISFGNTAHLSGLAAGLVLGRTRWFRMTRHASN